MKRILILLLIIISLPSFAVKVEKQNFEKIEQLICRGKYKQAEKLLSSVRPFINDASYEQKYMFFFCSGLLSEEREMYDNAISAYGNAMQIIYDTKSFNCNEHFKVSFHLASSYLKKGDAGSAEQIINVSLVRGSDIFENCRYTPDLYNCLIEIYKQKGILSGIIATAQDERDRIKNSADSSLVPTINQVMLSNQISNRQYENADSTWLETYVYEKDSLCNIYARMNRLDEAERLLKEMEDSLYTKGYQNNPIISLIYKRKAELYFRIGYIDKAKEMLLRVKKIYEQNGYMSRMTYPDCLNSLALTYQEEGMFLYSSLLLYAALGQIQSRDDEIHGRFAITDNLARNYYSMGDHEAAIQKWAEIIDLAEAKEIWDSAFSALVNYAYAQMNIGNYETAIEKLHGMISRDYDYMLKEAGFQILLMLQFFADDQRIIDTLKDYISYSKSNLSTILMTYSEKEREAYWREHGRVLGFLANAIANKFQFSDINGIAYDMALYKKALQFDIIKGFKNYIRTNSQDLIKKQYKEALALKKKLLNKVKTSEVHQQLVDSISAIERELLVAYSQNANINNDSLYSYKEIRFHLGDNDVALEFIEIPEIYSRDSSIVYLGALILRTHFENPQIVKLCPKPEIEKYLSNIENNSDYANTLYASNDNSLYRMLFQPLEQYLRDGDYIYYSPIGLLHKINIGAIPLNASTNMRLMDKYHLNRVMTTSTLIFNNARKGQRKELARAVLFGGIDYNVSDDNDKTQDVSCINPSPHTENSIRSAYRNMWDEIPGSLQEVESIQSILSKKRVATEMFSGKHASEIDIKRLDGISPTYIHIATHGYFFSDVDKPASSFFSNMQGYTGTTIPMQLSGLLFSGSNYTWTGGYVPEDREDGILTAEEISHLDFSNTNLAVLSACDTGLGILDDVDGIYGLQRGFKMAGVESLIMSLWKVDDEATKILMVEFYKNLMSGKTKLQSLRDAQKYLRQVENGKYNEPKYWASFILLDGLD